MINLYIKRMNITMIHDPRFATIILSIYLRIVGSVNEAQVVREVKEAKWATIWVFELIDFL